MIRTQQIPEELLEDYLGNHERRDFAFMNLYSKMTRKNGNYRHIFCTIIRAQDVTTVKKNLLEYLKLLIVNNCLKLDSHFGNSIFQALIWIGLDKHRDEFQLAILMLTSEDLQRKYLDDLGEILAKNFIEHQNFGLQVLYKLMKNSILLLEGKIKGPNVTSTSIDNLINLCINQVQLRSLEFNHDEDYSNFLLICSYTIKMVRKFRKKNILQAVRFERVWVKTLKKIQYVEPQKISVDLINSLFALFQQLCVLKQGSFYQKLEATNVYDSVLMLTSRFIFKCQNISNFWESYFKIRQTILNPPLQNINTDFLSGIFTSLLIILPQNIQQVAQKLKVADNLVFCSTIKCEGTQIMASVLRIFMYEMPNVQVDISILLMFANLLIKMMQRMSDDKIKIKKYFTQTQCAKIYEMISHQLLKYVFDISQIDKEGLCMQLRNDIVKHTNKVRVLEYIQQTDFLKNMVAAKLILQESIQQQMIATSLKDQWINIEALGMKQFAQDCKNDPVGTLIKFGIIKKFIRNNMSKGL